MEVKNIQKFRAALLAWNRKSNSREMPWKGIKDPYHIWLSEVILQQTRVDQGIKYYERFVSRYPSLKDLAEAPEDEVFKLWEGLGYYSRCRNLLVSARDLLKNSGGTMPQTYAGLLKMQGVGPYTAAAISSFAYNLPHAVVDGNVIRVLARYFAVSLSPATAYGRKFFNELAGQCLSPRNPAIYNQAIMDFGATICRPRNPECTLCPLQKDCQAFAASQTAAYPAKVAAPPKQVRHLLFIKLTVKDQVMVQKRQRQGIWPMLYTYAILEGDMVHNLSGQEVEERLYLEMGVSGKIKAITGIKRHILTHQVLFAKLAAVECTNIPEIPGFEIFPQSRLEQLAFPVLLRLLEKELE